MKRNSTTLKYKDASGFTLIEVLISLIIISIGVLGLIGLQVSGLQANQSASNRSQAVLAASDMLDRMRANRTAALGNAYNISMSSNTPTSTATLAQADLAEWFTRVENWLPAGDASIELDAATSVFTITLQWDESRMRDGSAQQQFVFETQI